jgi:PHD/YefM family antitoxin component YafN of YafNO toxin-antitoxin module
MSVDEYKEKEVSDSKAILDFVKTVESQKSELVLLSDGKNVGAILNAEQYEWFLDQLDAQQDIESINDRATDLEGSQSLEDLKKELEL